VPFRDIEPRNTVLPGEGAILKHPYSHQLFAYWNERRGERPAPERSDIDPGAMRRILGDSFVLSSQADQIPTFRVAGTRLCALFGQELRGEPFTTIWDGDSAVQIRDLTTIIADEGVGIVAGASAHAAHDLQCHFEMVLLPLAHRGQLGRRMLGSIATLERPYWLGVWPAAPLSLGVIQFIGADTTPESLVKADALHAFRPKRHNLTVIPGGLP
jgi:hypothetical protein